MKNVVLSHDDELTVFSVPDKVADNLYEYCLEFCNEWILNSPHAEKLRCTVTDLTGNQISCMSYTSTDFIEYLNEWICPEQQSVLVENLGIFDAEEIPEKYKDCPRFNF